MQREQIDSQNWVPWVGVALVLPAVLVLLVGGFGVYFGLGHQGSTTNPNGPGPVGITAAAITMAAAFGALILALVGIVRGIRRPVRHTGRSIGIAGVTFEIGVLIIAVAALIMLGFRFLI
jgi:hypothetical protein